MKKRKNKYKSFITRIIFKSIRKIGVCLLILVFSSSFMAMRGTNAGFLDEEKSEENILNATSLDGRASYIEFFNIIGMVPGSQPDQSLIFYNEGGLDFKYKIKYKNTGGDSELCDALLLTAERNGTKVYDKQLLKDFDLADFSGNSFSIAVFGNDNWKFMLELPDEAGNNLENKNCQFIFDFSAWQTNFADNSHGFTDEEMEGTNVVRTGNWVNPGDVAINEIMWMGSDGHSSDEWIELKNMTPNPINIGGWEIEKAGLGGTAITIPAGKTIAANGYFLIANYAKTSSSSSLNVSADYIANLSLDNDSNDNLILKTANVIIDSAKGTPWSAGSNGTQKQSMERNDIPDDGLLAGSWHTCVSGAANGSPYWDTTGNNYGTPGAANLSPIAINEFIVNPVGDDSAKQPDGEWAELYNISDKKIDVNSWYFKNSQDEKIIISENNTNSGKTVVPEKGRLVVYFEKDYLGNDKDKLSLYNDMGTPEDDSDDVEEDTHAYQDAGAFPEGKSFARFPDGEGIWIDPEATPGEENKMDQKEIKGFQLLAYNECFDGEKIKEDNKAEICAPVFLQYLEMIKDLDDKNIKDSTLIDILEIIILEEEKKLKALLEETMAMVPEVIKEVAGPKEEPTEEKTEEVPADEPKETPAIETPAN